MGVDVFNTPRPWSRNTSLAGGQCNSLTLPLHGRASRNTSLAGGQCNNYPRVAPHRYGGRNTSLAGGQCNPEDGVPAGERLLVVTPPLREVNATAIRFEMAVKALRRNTSLAGGQCNKTIPRYSCGLGSRNTSLAGGQCNLPWPREREGSRSRNTSLAGGQCNSTLFFFFYII